MRQLSYDQFTCHTEIDNQPHLRTNSQSISIADIHTADTNRKLQQIAFESIEYLQQEEAEEKEYIILQNSIRQQLAMQLKIENLAKFDFSNLENKIQLIFQWIIVVFYRTSSEMFEWKSFKEICIIEDKGVDLRNRIGLKNIVRMTKLEFELTKQLMLYRSSIESKNNNNKEVVQFISQIFDIIQIIIRTFEAGQKVMRIEEELIKVKFIISLEINLRKLVKGGRKMIQIIDIFLYIYSYVLQKSYQVSKISKNLITLKLYKKCKLLMIKTQKLLCKLVQIIYHFRQILSDSRRFVDCLCDYIYFNYEEFTKK